MTLTIAESVRINPFTPGMQAKVSFTLPFSTEVHVVDGVLAPHDPSGLNTLNILADMQGEQQRTKNVMPDPNNPLREGFVFSHDTHEERLVRLVASVKSHDRASRISKTVLAYQRVNQSEDEWNAKSGSFRFGDSELSLVLGGEMLARFKGHYRDFFVGDEPTPYELSAAFLMEMFGPESPLNLQGTYGQSFVSQGGDNIDVTMQTKFPHIWNIMNSDGTKTAYKKIHDDLLSGFGQESNNFSVASYQRESDLERAVDTPIEHPPLTVDFSFNYSEQSGLNLTIKPRGEDAYAVGALYFTNKGIVSDLIREILDGSQEAEVGEFVSALSDEKTQIILEGIYHKLLIEFDQQDPKESLKLFQHHLNLLPLFFEDTQISQRKGPKEVYEEKRIAVLATTAALAQFMINKIYGEVNFSKLTEEQRSIIRSIFIRGGIRVEGDDTQETVDLLIQVILECFRIGTIDDIKGLSQFFEDEIK